MNKIIYFSKYILTIGASLVIGLLSFGGMYAILPIWQLALVTFALSVAYESHIYFKTIGKVFAKKNEKLQLKNYLIISFSVITSLLMTIGSTYLLQEAISAIPYLTNIIFISNPIFIGALAFLGGVAFGLLTYNALDKFFSPKNGKNVIIEIFEKFKKKDLFYKTAMIFFSVLTLGLTICTAGTWVSIARQGKSAISIVQKLPFFVMGIFQPIFTGIASLAFNLKNIVKSVDKIYDMNWENQWLYIKNKFVKFFKEKNILQIINPFNIVILLTKQPIRVLAFIGHLVSIALTADRVPGIAPLYSALLGFVNEFIEDFHFFFNLKKADCAGVDSTEDVTQEQDIPSKIINFAYVPLEFCSGRWDKFFADNNSLVNSNQISPPKCTTPP